MTFISYAQNYEDVMLWRALKYLDSGFYIDIGAAWPDEHSVTKAFYERGWHGINVEPNPDLFSQLSSRRPKDINLQLAIFTQDGEAEISIVKNTGLSTLRQDIADQHINQGWPCEKINVITKTLSSIWASYVPDGQDVHFLKLDVEGSEELVIKSNDWSKNRPWIVVVESTLPLSQIENHELWQSQLLAFNYKFVYADGLNRFYLAGEHSSLSSCFTYPPNYFDGFQLASQRKAEAKLAKIKNLNQELKIKLAAIQEDNLCLENQNNQLISGHKVEAEFNKIKNLNRQIKNEILDVQKNNLHLKKANQKLKKELKERQQQANKHRRELEEQNNQLLAENQRLLADLYLLANGRSMRVTKPLRLLLNLARQLRYWTRDQSAKIAPQNLKVKSRINFFGGNSGKVLARTFLVIYKNPRLNSVAKNFLGRVPQLESTLRRVYTRAVYSESGQELNIYPKELSHLSPTARRIYSDLKKAVDKHREGDH
jgi:FkbM family methyltransferase